MRILFILTLMQFSKGSNFPFEMIVKSNFNAIMIVKRKAFLKVCLVSKYTFFMIVNELLTWIVLTRNRYINIHIYIYLRIFDFSL